MKTLKRYLAASLIAVSGGAHADSIVDIYQLALENDPQLKADQAAYRAGLQSETIGRAGLLPQINASGSYTASDNDTDASYLNGNPVSGPTSNGETTEIVWRLSLEQAVLDLNAWHTYKQGSALSEQAEAQYAADQQSLIVRVAEAYFNVLRAIDNLEVSLAEEKALGQQLEQTKQRFEVGLTPITDVHDAQAAYDTALASTLEMRGQLGIAYEGLEVLTGKNHDEIAPLEEEFPVVPPSPEDRHEWVEFALENNFNLKAAGAAANAAEQSAKASRANHLPTVSASAGYTVMDHESDQNGLPNNYYDRDGHSFGLTLRVPLFSGLRTSGQRRQAYARALEADENFNFQQRNVIQSTRSLHLSVETGVARVKARKQAIVSNESAVKATQSGFEVGTRNLVEVLLAQQSLYQARRDYSNALYDYLIQMINLREAAGMLTPADVERIDGYLQQAEQVSRSDYDV